MGNGNQIDSKGEAQGRELEINEERLANIRLIKRPLIFLLLIFLQKAIQHLNFTQNSLDFLLLNIFVIHHKRLSIIILNLNVEQILDHVSPAPPCLKLLKTYFFSRLCFLNCQHLPKTLSYEVAKMYQSHLP